MPAQPLWQPPEGVHDFLGDLYLRSLIELRRAVGRIEYSHIDCAVQEIKMQRLAVVFPGIDDVQREVTSATFATLDALESYTIGSKMTKGGRTLHIVIRAGNDD